MPHIASYTNPASDGWRWRRCRLQPPAADWRHVTDESLSPAAPTPPSCLVYIAYMLALGCDVFES